MNPTIFLLLMGAALHEFGDLTYDVIRGDHARLRRTVISIAVYVVVLVAMVVWRHGKV